MFNIVTEDGLFNLAQENNGLILQEFLGITSSVTATGQITATVSPTVTVTGTVSATGTVTGTAINAVSISASITATGQTFTAASKANTASGVVSASGVISASVTPTVNVSATITERNTIQANAGGAVSITALISATGTVTVTVQSTRPEPITNFRAARSGSTVSLTWVNGLRTAKVEVYRSTGVRATFSKIGETTSEFYTDSVSSGETYSYQLVPIGNTGARSKASYIIYSATDNVL